MATTTWIFTQQQMDSSPSRLAGIDADRELLYRQQAATLIQDMGQRLNVPQLVINTAIVYMHRFFMFHSFKDVHKHLMAQAAIFLAAKVEDQPRKVEHVIRVAQACLSPHEPQLNPKHVVYLQKAQDLIMLETMLLKTLGFDVTVVHPHTHVVKCSQLVRASKDLAHTSYFMATNSLHLTTLCLRYAPSVVACVCIHLACKWSSWEIPMSSDGQPWWAYVDTSVTLQLLDELTQQFLDIMDKTPNRMKRICNWKAHQHQAKKMCVDVTSKPSAGCDVNPSTSCSTLPCAGTSSAIADVTARPWSETQPPLPCARESLDPKSDIDTQQPQRQPGGSDGGGARFFVNDNRLGSLIAVGRGEAPASALARYPAPQPGVAPDATLGQQPLPLSSCALVLRPPAPTAPAGRYSVPFCGPRLEPDKGFACNVPGADVALNPAVLVPSLVLGPARTQSVNPDHARRDGGVGVGVVPACDPGRAAPTRHVGDPNAGPPFAVAMGPGDYAGAFSLSGRDLQPCSSETSRSFRAALATTRGPPHRKPPHEQSGTEAGSPPAAAGTAPAPSFRAAPPAVRDDDRRQSGHGAQGATGDPGDAATQPDKVKRNGGARELRNETRAATGDETRHRCLVKCHAGADGGKEAVGCRAAEASVGDDRASNSYTQLMPAPYVASHQMHQQWPPQYSLHRDPKSQFTETQNVHGFQGTAGGGRDRALQQHRALTHTVTSGPSMRPDIGSNVQLVEVGPPSSANKKRAPKTNVTWLLPPERSSSSSTCTKPEVDASNRLLPPEPISRLPPSPNICTASVSSDRAPKVDGVASGGPIETVPLRNAQPVAVETQEPAQWGERNQEGGSAVHTVVP